MACFKVFEAGSLDYFSCSSFSKLRKLEKTIYADTWYDKTCFYAQWKKSNQSVRTKVTSRSNKRVEIRVSQTKNIGCVSVGILWLSVEKYA